MSKLLLRSVGGGYRKGHFLNLKLCVEMRLLTVVTRFSILHRHVALRNSVLMDVT